MITINAYERVLRNVVNRAELIGEVGQSALEEKMSLVPLPEMISHGFYKVRAIKRLKRRLGKGDDEVSKPNFPSRFVSIFCEDPVNLKHPRFDLSILDITLVY